MTEQKAFTEEARIEGNNISRLRSRLGISSKTAYQWLKWVEKEGPDRLEDHIKRPKNSPKRVEVHMESSIQVVRWHRSL